MFDTVFGIKVRLSGLCIHRYRPIIGRLLDGDYRPADNWPLPYRCISIFNGIQLSSIRSSSWNKLSHLVGKCRI